MTKVTLIGDVHIGMKQSQTTKFKQILKQSEKVILMGDIINGVTKKDKRHDRDDIIMSVDDEILLAQKIIKPYRAKVLKYVIGNHEDSLLTYLDVDAVKLICEPLNISYSYTEVLNIDNTTIAVNHGTGAPQTYGGAILQLEKFKNNFPADFNCIGHTHKLFNIQEKIFPDKTTELINTGTLLGNTQYANKMKFPPAVLGYYIIDTVTKQVERVIL